MKVNETFKDLKQQYGENYSGPQLRLWARMIANVLHESLNDPPQMPMITGHVKKKGQKSLTEALTGAAVVFFIASPYLVVNLLVEHCHPVKLQNCVRSILSILSTPYLQQLMEDRVLSESEFLEHKQVILDAHRNIQ